MGCSRATKEAAGQRAISEKMFCKTGRAGFIYFIENVNRQTKIGRAKSVYALGARLLTANTWSPGNRVRFVMHGNAEYEQKLHAMFRQYRGLGEWFFWSLEINNYINANKLDKCMFCCRGDGG